MMKRVLGFTLIELMVVVAVVAILAAIAIPTFTQQLRKSRRSDAVQGIGDLQLRQERWRASHTSYAANMDTLLGSAAATASFNAASNYYTFTIDNVTATGFRVNATAKGAQVDDNACTPMRLTVAAGAISKSPVGCW